MVICILINLVIVASNFFTYPKSPCGLNMITRTISLFVFLVCLCTSLLAQKPFTEGRIVYQVKMGPDDPEITPGTFTITVKGEHVKKEMHLNGQEHIIIINCLTNKVYSLQNRNNKKYAIELSMDDVMKDQEQFKGFSIKKEYSSSNKIAGFVVSIGNAVYKDGTSTLVSFSKEWKPVQPIIFDRFPGATFMPLEFLYKDESGLSMKFVAEKVETGPVENALFRIPADYQIISYAEYKELTR